MACERELIRMLTTKAAASLVCMAAVLAATGGARAQHLTPSAVLRDDAAPSQAQRRHAEERSERPPPAASGTPVEGTPAGMRVALRVIEVEGASAIPPASIEAALAGYTGREIAETELAAIANVATELFRAAGFHLSRAVIMPQDLRNGRLRLSVIEGAIEEIRIEGDAEDRFGLRGLLAPISAERPSRRRTLERQLLLANDRPGVRVIDTALDEIAPASGRFRLTVKVQSWTAYLALGADNVGSAAVGPWQASTSAAANSLVVPGDSLAIAASTVPGATRELRYGRVSYDLPLGVDSWRIGVAASRSVVWPGDARRWDRTRSQADTVELRGSYAPLVTKTQMLWTTAAVAISDVEEENGFGRIYRDRLKLASLAADYKLNAREGSWTYLNATYRQGLGFLDHDGGDWLSRRGASGRFSLVNGAITHYQNLVDSWSIKLAAAGQISSGPLLSSQQYYLGGNWFGRGLPGGWISGDDAAAGSAELRYDQATNFAFAKGYQLYGFIEGGLTKTKFDQGEQIQRIVSVGVGVRLFIDDNLQIGVGIAKPILYRSPIQRDSGATVLVSLTNALRLCPSGQGLRCAD